MSGLFNPPLDALSLYQRISALPRLSFGCEILDSAFNGGLTTGIYEIAGEAGTGKTQLAMQLMLNARLPIDLGGFNSSSIFLNSESDFPVDRLYQLAESWQKRYSYIEIKKSDFLDRIYLDNVKTVESLFRLIFEKLPALIEKSQSKLLIIDSIAAIFRSDEGGTANSNTEQSNNSRFIRPLAQRAEDFFRLSAQLKILAAKYSLVILILNQVTDVVQNEENSHSDRSGLGLMVKSSGRSVIPALGLAWSNCVETRIFLTRTRNQSQQQSTIKPANEESEEESATASAPSRPTGAEIGRQLFIMFSPALPRSKTRFVLDTDGIHGVSSTQIDHDYSQNILRPSVMPSPSFATPDLNSIESTTPIAGSLWQYP